jgi:branched-chain amino acid transport system permease protein
MDIGPADWDRPGWSRVGGGSALFVLLAIWLLTTGSPLSLYEGSLVLVYAVAALGQDWLVGRAGQISLGAAAFLAIGAFTTGRLASVGWAVFPVPLLVSAVFGGLVGLVVGVSGLRFRGLYLALSTLALQFVVSYLAQDFQGGNLAGYTVKPPSIGGVTFSQGRSLDLLLIVILGLVMLGLHGMYSRSPGRAWSAIQQNEQAAAVAGIDVVRWKLLAFVGSSAVTALAGGLLAYQAGSVTYEPFTLELGISVLVMIFVGGIGSLWGAIVGSALVILLPYWIQDIGGKFAGTSSVSTWLSSNQSELADAIYGLALLLVLLYERRGLIGIFVRVALFALRLGRQASRMGRNG